MSGWWIGTGGQVYQHRSRDLWWYGHETFEEAKQKHISHLEERISDYQNTIDQYKHDLESVKNQTEEPE
jgi:hypothetical protein